MKKYFLSIVALAGMLFATSCQESLVEPQVSGETTFTVQVPTQMGTKAINEWYKLYVDVYKADDNTRLERVEKAIVSDPNTPTTVTLNLVNTQEYDIIFWAQKEYAYDVADLTNIKMRNHHNSEDGAAYYAIINNFKPADGNSRGVALTRPFAQLNIGSLLGVSYSNVPVEINSAKITVSEVASEFNRVDMAGTVGVGQKGVNYVGEGEPYSKQVSVIEVQNKEYAYVSMDYLPVVNNKAVVNVAVELNVTDPSGVESVITRTISNVPLQMNYKTNIVGNFITSASDFTVTIDENWLTPDNDRVENFVEVEVSTPAQLQEALTDPEVDAVILTQDIDLSAGLVFGTPSKADNDLPGRNFVIDGNGSTLTYKGAAGGRIIDFKAETSGANLTIKNLTIINNVSWIERAVNYNTNGTLTLEDVTIKSAEGCSLNYAINLPGSSDNAKVEIKNCEIEANAQALNLWGERTVVNVTDSRLYTVDNNETESYNAIALNNDGTNSADYSEVKVIGGTLEVIGTYAEGSYTIRNNTVHGVVDVSETTNWNRTVLNPVAIIYWEGQNSYYSKNDLNDALEQAVPKYKATGVRMINDLTLPLAKKAIYGTAVAVQMNNGGVFDGCNNTLSVENPKYEAYVVETYGGTIKNLNITTPAGRGIIISSPKEDIYLDNVFVDGPGYALNTTEHNGKNLYVNNSTFKGWTSLAGLASVSFISCTFGENTYAYWQKFGYDKDYDRLIRPYVQTVFESCIFEQYFYVDLSALGANAKVTLKSCKCGDVTITKANYDQYITIELPAGRTLDNCVEFE